MGKRGNKGNHKNTLYIIPNYMKGQIVQWFGQRMRKEKTNETRLEIKYKPIEKTKK